MIDHDHSLPACDRPPIQACRFTKDPDATSESRLLGFPQPFDSIEHARAFCREFYYNHDHRHCGLGLMTPAAVHHGHAKALHDDRARVLAAAYAATPERFVRRPPTPPALPTAAWINKPDNQETAH